MGSSTSKGNLFDPLRLRFVAAGPEEKVRQNLLERMINALGFPRGSLGVEKELSELPHLIGQKALPKRRADLICFGRDIHPNYPIYPLLLIECKRGDLAGDLAKQQALGYNHYVGAAYVALASEDLVELIHPVSLSFLPTYSELLRGLCR